MEQHQLSSSQNRQGQGQVELLDSRVRVPRHQVEASDVITDLLSKDLKAVWLGVLLPGRNSVRDKYALLVGDMQ